ncbi:MAG: hemerythrin domain-containing protein [Actinomycetota bacterium]|nr:hemerythrin domain-containing protein [Acidimicrobiia bacterium]MDQ3293344.1 hemerythrin domain-containing protein [Actinomycetota bacterium]
MPNGIDLILADHQAVSAAFDAFESTLDATIVARIIDQLRAHDDAEHAALYPLAAIVLEDAALLDASLQAHAGVKRQIDHLRAQEGAPFVEAVAGLRALVDAHVADEEKRLLPALQAAATERQLDELGGRILQAKQRVG